MNHCSALMRYLWIGQYALPFMVAFKLGSVTTLPIRVEQTLDAFFRVEVKTILFGPIWSVLKDIVYGGNALRIPTGVADVDVICVFKKGSQWFWEKIGGEKCENERWKNSALKNATVVGDRTRYLVVCPNVLSATSEVFVNPFRQGRFVAANLSYNSSHASFRRVTALGVLHLALWCIGNIVHYELLQTGLIVDGDPYFYQIGKRAFSWLSKR